MENLKTQD